MLRARRPDRQVQLAWRPRGQGGSWITLFHREYWQVRTHSHLRRELWVIMTALGSEFWKKKSKAMRSNGLTDGWSEWTGQSMCH